MTEPNYDKVMSAEAITAGADINRADQRQDDDRKCKNEQSIC
jgi:hypothetical protein